MAKKCIGLHRFIEFLEIYEALLTLTAPQEDVIVLEWWGGLSQTEVAERLGIDYRSVQSRERWAFKKLAKLFNQEYRQPTPETRNKRIGGGMKRRLAKCPKERNAEGRFRVRG